MKLLSIAALLAALTPLAASAQQAQQPYPAPPQQQMTAAPGPQGQNRFYDRWSRLLGGLNLSGQQQQQIQGILDSYSQSHPAGSPRDPQGRRALMQQVYGVLTPQQQGQLRQTILAQRAQRLQQQLQRIQQQQQQGGGAPPPQR